jgi:hypothetical protein
MLLGALVDGGGVPDVFVDIFVGPVKYVQHYEKKEMK